MTDRIYYTNPACRTFEAVVTQAFDHAGRPAVVLDRTAFYPASGGQPFDTGALTTPGVILHAGATGKITPGVVFVVETIDVDDEIVHIVSASIAPGERVRGDVDWTRRADHMQQHTGQHVLSAVFDRLFDNRTISFHMGDEMSTIDLARELRAEDVERGVDEANRVVWEDRPVSIRFVSAEEAGRLPLRKEPVREGTLRLIEIEDFDLSACGGTHVARTGEIGMIAVLSSERFRGGARLTFACGGRVLRALRTYRDAVAGSVRVLSVLPHELPMAIDRLQADAKELRKTVNRLQESLAVHEAARLLAGASHASGARLVVQALDGWDAPGLKAIASALTSHAGVVAALFSTSSPAVVVVARSAGVGVDANTVLRQLTERFGGRGGGKPDLAQGGGLSGSGEEMTALARTLLA
jgi:alanyl-tRNA synthetase